MKKRCTLIVKRDLLSVTKAFAYTANIGNEVLDFDMSEELYAVLGVRASDSTTKNEIYRLEQFGDLEKYIKTDSTKLGIAH